MWLLAEPGTFHISGASAPVAGLTCSCCWRARSICCRCFSICEAASFFCSSCAARSCSRKLISWVIMVESCRSFSARLSGVPKMETRKYLTSLRKAWMNWGKGGRRADVDRDFSKTRKIWENDRRSLRVQGQYRVARELMLGLAAAPAKNKNCCQ